jgi:hypothetical protein
MIERVPSDNTRQLLDAIAQAEAALDPQDTSERTPKGFALAPLLRQGDSVVLGAGALPTQLILGSRETDEASSAKSKRLILWAQKTEQGTVVWRVEDRADSGVWVTLPTDGSPYNLGRANQDLFPGELRTKTMVSREHVSAVATGNEVTLVQQGGTNGTFVMAPMDSVRVYTLAPKQLPQE